MTTTLMRSLSVSLMICFLQSRDEIGKHSGLDCFRRTKKWPANLKIWLMISMHTTETWGKRALRSQNGQPGRVYLTLRFQGRGSGKESSGRIDNNVYPLEICHFLMFVRGTDVRKQSLPLHYGTTCVVGVFVQT